MASLFDKLEDARRKAKIPDNTKRAQDWFRNRMGQLVGRVRPGEMLNDSRVSRVSRPMPGYMYHFLYDPKTKEQLPYYDRFPLIIMVGKAPGGFHGLNLHYLPPILRARFLDSLSDTMSDNKFDENTRFRARYNLLKSAAKFRYFKPCFKHYLTQHVTSRIVQVEASEWDMAVFLPTEQFVGASKRKVWNDSRMDI